MKAPTQTCIATLAALAMASTGAARAQVLEIGDDGTAQKIGGGWTTAPAATAPSKSTAWRAEFEAAAAANDLDPDFLTAVARTESALDPRALSPAGAIGLMQLMPATARGLGVDPWDPRQNIMGGARHLRALLDRFDGRIDLALAAYNAGSGAVTRYGGVPPYAETRTYVDRNLDRLATMAEANNQGHAQ